MGHVGKTVTQNVVSGSEITDGTVTGADLASDIAISTSGAITTTGAFTSKGIDDNADATAITIDSNEHVGIGTASPSTQLHIDEATSNSYATMRLEGNNRGGDIEMYQGTVPVSTIRGDQSGNLYFKTSGAYGNSSVSTKLTLGTAGDLTIDNGNLVIGTSGKGIDFSATTDGYNANGSELLSDYERGAYNLTFNGFSQQTVSQGSYVRVGHLCFVTMMLHALGSQNSNQFTCTLPFTSQSFSASNNVGYYSSTTSQVMHHNVDTGTVGLAAFVVQGTNTYKIYKINEDGAWGAINNNQFSSENQAFVSLTYIVA